MVLQGNLLVSLAFPRRLLQGNPPVVLLYSLNAPLDRYASLMKLGQSVATLKAGSQPQRQAVLTVSKPRIDPL